MAKVSHFAVLKQLLSVRSLRKFLKNLKTSGTAGTRSAADKSFQFRKQVRNAIFNFFYPLPILILQEDQELLKLIDQRFPSLVIPRCDDSGRFPRAVTTETISAFDLTRNGRIRLSVLLALLLSPRPIITVSRAPLSLEIRDVLDSSQLMRKLGTFSQLKARHLGLIQVSLESSPNDESHPIFENNRTSRVGLVSQSEVRELWNWSYCDTESKPARVPDTEMRLILQERISEKAHLLATQSGGRYRPPLTQRAMARITTPSGNQSFGFGDIVIGAALVHEEAMKSRRLALIDWRDYPGMKNSPISGGLDLSDSTRARRKISVQVNSDRPVDFSFQSHVLTNRRPAKVFNSTTIDFLLRNGLAPTEEIKDRVSRWLRKNKLEAGEFSIVHIRFGDPLSQKSSTEAFLLEALQRVSDSGEALVVLADHPEKIDASALHRKTVIKIAVNQHSANVASPADFLGTLEDFYLMGCGAKIYQISTYSWGSGFSQSASGLLQVPLVPLVSKVRGQFTHLET